MGFYNDFFKKRCANTEIVGKGWKVTPNWQVETVPPTISPEEFFTRFVQARKPVIINGHFSDPTWLGARWTDDYLIHTAGEGRIQVEQRVSETSAFGLAAPKVEMTFGELVKKLANREELYYLTTQTIPENQYGYESLFAEPLNHLQSDFPLRPKLFGNLIPYQMNLWMGVSKNGSSSGLHHDYHDNLYVLLRGRKRFTLFSPNDAPNLYITGKISKIHPNGLINYVGAPTRADGANPVEVSEKAVSEAQNALDDAEINLERLTGDVYVSVAPGELEEAQNAVREAEDQLNIAMEAALDASEAVDVDDEAADIQYPNFSKISVEEFYPTTKQSQQNVNKKYPRLKNAIRTVCHIQEGQMLYLPASWFHEVSSFGENTHMAMNYWVYPPDSDSFEQPYRDNFWHAKWEQFLAEQHEMNSRDLQSPPSKRQKREIIQEETD